MKRPAVSVANRAARPDLEQLRLVTRVARLHYIHGERQAAIAEKLGMSQASVSRFLAMAEEQGIVRKVVVPPDGLYPDLEDGLVESYGLHAAHVVDISATEGGIAHVLGAAAAQCLTSVFKQGPTLGLTSWSNTLREMVRSMAPLPASAAQRVVELLGDLGSPLLQHEAAIATLQMAKALDAEPVFLRTPGVVARADMVLLAREDAHIKSALRLLDQLDVAFMGVGPVGFHGALQEGDNFFTAQQLADVKAQGAVGQLNLRFIDVAGNALDTPLDDLVIGMSLKQLRAARCKVMVAGGAAKHAAIAAALAGRWVDVLVTDVNTATHLMANKQKKKT